MEILVTKNYDQFKLINSNREINTAHVQKLKESIEKKNLMRENPVLVNSKNEMVDGQHRLQACRELGIDLFYIVSDNVNREDISTLNSNKRNWTLTDYLNFFTAEGKENYRLVSRFVNSHPKIPLSGAILLLGVASKGVLIDFKTGDFHLVSNEDANTLAQQIDSLSQFGKFVYGIVFIRAYNKVARLSFFDFKKFLYKIEKAPKQFVPGVDEKQMVEIMEEIYNRDVPHKNRVSFKS